MTRDDFVIEFFPIWGFWCWELGTFSIWGFLSGNTDTFCQYWKLGNLLDFGFSIPDWAFFSFRDFYTALRIFQILWIFILKIKDFLDRSFFYLRLTIFNLGDFFGLFIPGIEIFSWVGTPLYDDFKSQIDLKIQISQFADFFK